MAQNNDISNSRQDLLHPPNFEIKGWLEQAGLEQYSDVFIKEKISVDSLGYLEESHLKELGLSVGDRVKFKMSLDNVKRNPTAPTIGPSGNREQAESPPNSTENSTNKIPIPQRSPTHRRAPSEQNHSTSSLPLSTSLPVSPTANYSSSNLSTSSPKKPPVPQRNHSAENASLRSQTADKNKSNSANSLRKSTIPSSPTAQVIPKSTSTSSLSEIPPNAEEYQCKIVIIGPPAAGKTSLVRRFTYGTFERGYKQTIGVDFEVRTVKWSENLVMHVQLWDIAGQERFSAVVPQFYRNAAAALVVFDVTDEATLQSALKWNEHLQKHEIQSNGNNIPVMLIANKADLLPPDKPTPDFETICKENRFAKWTLTSAKTNQGIEDAILYLVERILTYNGVNGNDEETNQAEHKIDLSKPTKKKEESGCCS